VNLGEKDQFSDGFKAINPRQQVPVLIEVIAVDDEVSQMETDAEYDLLVLGLAQICYRHSLLEFDGRSKRIHNTGEFDSAPSPMNLTIRPPFRATAGSSRSARCTLNRASVSLSSRPISFEKPTAPSARIAASLRCSRAIEFPTLMTEAYRHVGGGATHPKC
jgi:hypothetical protein